MVRMEEIQAALDLMMNRPARRREYVDATGGGEGSERVEGGQKDQVLGWFAETQASLVLRYGKFPSWFHGFVSRQEAEDHLRDRTLGCFLIRLSEKSSGYILSYKGQDRCRHFVINQTKDGLLVVTGDSMTHNSLPELIEFFKTTPIQPFGECLVSENEPPSDDVYDMVHCKPAVRSGVSVQALRSLWDQRSDITSKGPPTLPPKTSSRKLISTTSIDRNSVQRNLPLRNSLSGGHLSHGSGPHAQSDQRWQSQTRPDEALQRRGIRTWESEAFSSLDSHLESYLEPGGHLSTCDGHTNSHHSSRSRSLPRLDEDYSHSSPSAILSVPASPQQPSAQPKLASFLSSSLSIKEKDQLGSNIALNLNPLYQTSSGLCSGRDSSWGPHSHPKPSGNPADDDHATPHNTYQLIMEHHSSNTYKDLPTMQQDNLTTQENNTYEDLPEIQPGDLHIQDSNTYEDIPAALSNTYATVEELQPSNSSHGKKTHKWWKFKPENKKK